MTTRFLPMSKQEMAERGWTQLDVILVTGDAYVDHPSFGTAIIGRVLEAKGYRVGIIAQPDWHDPAAFKQLGVPRLFFGVNAGNLDSMVNHYTAAKKRRHDDAYSPGGIAGQRPDRATIVYANRLREIFGKVPIVIGGIEASLRRFAHYDYWDNCVRHSILVDTGADILVYGMGERPITEIAEHLDQGTAVGELRGIRGTVIRATELDSSQEYLRIPGFREVSTDKRKYAEAFRAYYREQDPYIGKTIAQENGKQYIIQYPPVLPLSTAEMDAIYALPFVRTYHPRYAEAGGVPAIKEVRFSITTHRGCFGGCAFCALVSHQGRIIQSRSKASILREAELLTKLPDFKGYIHDVGGPSANFWGIDCGHHPGGCRRGNCLYPKPCANLPTDQRPLVDLLRALRKIPGVKKVFVRSGIRYDFALAEPGQHYLRELCAHHISGQLKIAPEHIAGPVTRAMQKPGREIYKQFVREYIKINTQLGAKQYLVPYFMSSHPGSGLREAIELAEYIRDMGYNPEQVQDFTPTPMTISTCMYYTGLNPMTLQPIYVARSAKEKEMQRALLQFRDPARRPVVEAALRKAGRTDLIGSGRYALIPAEGKSVSKKDKQKGAKRYRRSKR